MAQFGIRSIDASTSATERISGRSSPEMSVTRFKLVFFTPRKNTAEILDHLFKKFPQDLGKIGQYERCAFVTPGTGRMMLLMLQCSLEMLLYRSIYAWSWIPPCGWKSG